MIEDSVLSVFIMPAILQRVGAHVFHDCWSDDMLSRLTEQSNNIDLVLINCPLPVMIDMDDATQAIKAHIRQKNIPLVAITASDPQQLTPKLKALGFSGLIYKPIGLRTFPQKVLTILEGTPVWDTNDMPPATT